MRNINELHPELQEKVEKLKTACEALGRKIGIREGLRTKEEEDSLYA